MVKCQQCGKRPAVWAVQDIAGELAISTLGNHYRGFRVTKLCDECKDMVQIDWLPLLAHTPPYRLVGTTHARSGPGREGGD